MSDPNQLKAYAQRYFVELPELATLGGVDSARVLDLIAAGTIPGPIYRIWPNGAFSSPIGGEHNGPATGTPVDWYAPAAAWWIRRSRGREATAAARDFAVGFAEDFAACLAREPGGPLGYPQAYADGRLDPEGTASAARAEWQDWIDGGYGVCLRQADAHHVVVKTCRRAQVIALTDSGRRELSDPQIDELLVLLAELEAVMLPFAPHQRPHGTPGLWIDAILARYRLGRTPETAPMEQPA